MQVFDFEYTKTLEKIYIQGQFTSQSGVYFPALNKIYINHDALDDIQKLVVFSHEFVHFKLMDGNLGIIIQDLDWLSNYLSWLFEIVADKEIQKHLIYIGIEDINKQLNYVMNNDLVELVYMKNEALILIAKMCVRIDERIQELIGKSLLVQEGLATFMSLNMSTDNVYKDLIYSVSRNFKRSLLPDLVREQQRQKKYILSLSNNPYTDGYLIAENIQKRFGEKNVFLTGVLSHSLPLCEFDLIGMPDTDFNTLLDSVLNCERRWKSILQLDQALFKNPYDAEIMNSIFKTMRFGIEDSKKSEYKIPCEFTMREIFGHPLVRQIEKLIKIESDFKVIITLARRISPFDKNTAIYKHNSLLSYLDEVGNNRRKVIEGISDIPDPISEFGKDATEKDFVTLKNKSRTYKIYRELIRRVKADGRI